mgnify:CR=1 FL=1
MEVLPLAVPASASSALRAAAAREQPGPELLPELRPLLLHHNPYGPPLS